MVVNTLETDYRAEVVAAGLLRNGHFPEKTHIVRSKGNRRETAKDIYKVKNEYAIIGTSEEEHLCVYANRTGIYDSLPEGIFHQSDRKAKNIDEVIHSFMEQRNEEKAARRYFQPFEMALDKKIVEAQICELKYNNAHLHEHSKNLFSEQWDVLNHLTVSQSSLFFRLISVISQAAGSFDMTEKILKIIFNCPVKIRDYKKSKKTIEAHKRVALGKWRLGINSVLGKTIAEDNPDLEVRIGPISAEQMKLFEHNKKDNLILKCMEDMLFPFDRNIKEKYIIMESEKKFRLSKPGSKTYLGINTTL